MLLQTLMKVFPLLTHLIATVPSIINFNSCNIIPIDILSHSVQSFDILVVLPLLPIRERIIIKSNHAQLPVASYYIQELVESLYCIKGQVQLAQTRSAN